MLETVHRRSIFRRWVIPVLILAVAGWFAWTSNRKEPGRVAQIEAYVLGLVESGRSATPMPVGLDAQLLRVREAILRTQAGVSLEIGASEGNADARSPATHEVVISVDGVELLGVRVLYAERTDAVTAVGYWIPEG